MRNQILSTALVSAIILTSCANDPVEPSPAKKIQTAEPTALLSGVEAFSNLDPCLIKDGDPELTNMTAGFPIPEGRIDLRKGAKVHIIGVDFPDKPAGQGSPQYQNQNYTYSIEAFFRSQSNAPLFFEWGWTPKWVTMPNLLETYGLGGSFFDGGFNGDAYWELARAAIAAVDDETDFSGVNFLFIVFPKGVTSEEIGTFVVHTQSIYEADEGDIPNLIMAGGTYVDEFTYIHEFAHGLGLTDTRDTRDVGNQQSGGMVYDLMNNYDFPELLVWHRFLLGFIDGSQLHCKVSSEATTHWVVPVAAKSDGVKGLVVPLTDTEAIVVESRRAIGYDTGLTRDSSLIGAVVYRLDTTIPYGLSPVQVVEVLQSGEETIFRGYRFKVVESGTFGDVVEVEKLN
jgi:M6 family metalloprotease-like protein